MLETQDMLQTTANNSHMSNIKILGEPKDLYKLFKV